MLQAGLRLLEEDEKRLETLRALIDEGDASGVSDDSVIDIWNDVLRERGLSRG